MLFQPTDKCKIRNDKVNTNFKDQNIKIKTYNNKKRRKFLRK
jgi:hypothetical protein